MATTTPNFGWAVPTSTDLVKNGAVAIETLGDSIDASLLDLKGGTTGQVLAKASGTDMDFSWVAQDDSNAIQNALLTTTGDTIYASSASTPARRAIGTTGQVLTVSGGIPVWATPAAGGGGKVLQVVNAFTNTDVASATSTFVATTLTATITPTSATSKILIFVQQVGLAKSAANSTASLSLRLLRGVTTIDNFAENAAGTGTAIINRIGGSGMTYLDSPATTSATTYSTSFKSAANNATVYVQETNEYSTITLMEIGA